MRAREPRRRSLVAIAGVAVVILLAAPQTAAAHLVHSGLGPFYDGAAHLVATPEELVTALALALLAGLLGAPVARRALLLVPATWLAGGIAGAILPIRDTPWLGAVTFLALGGLVALDAKLTATTFTGVAVVVATLHGALGGTGMPATAAGLLATLGTASVVFVVVALASARVVSLRDAWARIVVRVAGSWIAATGLLMLGWALRGTS
jgi:urease accessory protein